MKKVALVIGHNLRSQGAYSKKLNKTEYEYCKEVCNKVRELTGVDVYERKPNTYYTWEMDKVLSQINEKRYDYILEVHFNAAGKKAYGSECLVYWRNRKAQEVATKFLEMLQEKFGSRIRTKWTPIRLTKVVEVEEAGREVKKKVEVFENWKRKGLTLVQTSKVRGGYGICRSKGSYILIEPFFGTHEEDSMKFEDVGKVAAAYSEFINKLRKGAL